MRTPSIMPNDAQRETYIKLDNFVGQLGFAWRETDAESADQRSAGRLMTTACQCPTTH